MQASTSASSSARSTVRYVLKSDETRTLDITVRVHGVIKPLGGRLVQPGYPFQAVFPYDGQPVSVRATTTDSLGAGGLHCEIWIGQEQVAPTPDNPQKPDRTKAGYP